MSGEAAAIQAINAIPGNVLPAPESYLHARAMRMAYEGDKQALQFQQMQMQDWQKQRDFERQRQTDELQLRQQEAQQKQQKEQATASLSVLESAYQNPDPVTAHRALYMSMGGDPATYQPPKDPSQVKPALLSAIYELSGKTGVPVSKDLTAERPATGIAAEFEYAKAHGYSGDFIQYQNEDANRKRPSVTNTTINNAPADAASTDNNAELVASYRAPLTQFLTARYANSPAGKALVAAIREKNPGFDATKYRAANMARTNYTSGPQFQNLIQPAQTAANHLDALQELGRAIKQRDVQTINKVKAQYNIEFGSTPEVAFNTLAGVVKGDIAKAVVGSRAGEQDRADIAKNLSLAQSNGQIDTAINTYRQSMAGRLASAEKGWVAAGLPAEEYNTLINPSLQPMVAKIVAGGSITGKAGAGQHPADIQALIDAAK